MKKQVFKGTTLTRTKVVNRIIKTFLATDTMDRFDWYMDAHNYAIYISKTYNVPLVAVCGVIAALSPMKSWEQNKKIAYDFVRSSGKSGGHMKALLDKASLILSLGYTEEDVCKILNGRKITAFFLNILHPYDDSRVTIDRHALTIAVGTVCTDELYAGMTKHQYEFFVECYKLSAKKLGVSALLVQSATWVYYRNNKQLWK